MYAKWADVSSSLQSRVQQKTERKDFMSYLLDQTDEDHLINEKFLTVSASTFV